MRIKLIDRKFENNIFYIFLLILFLFCLIRNTGLYPYAFADEYYYNKFSRLQALAESSIPGYIYLWVYRSTNLCGDGYLECARILNSILFLSSTPFIYLIASRFSQKPTAIFVTLLALASPINSYTAFFMPEAFYFLSFWVFAWFLINEEEKTSKKYWAICGGLIGIASLIKPHAIFILPAIVFYFIVVYFKNPSRKISNIFYAISSFLAAVFLTKFSLGYIFAGKQGINFFGSFYTSLAGSSNSNINRYFDLFFLAASILKGHVVGICVMFSVPIAASINIAWRAITSKSTLPSTEKLALFSFLLLSNLILVVALFTASISVSDLNEASRLHMRYYNFAFPLFFLITISQLNATTNAELAKTRAIFALPIGIAIVYAIYTHMGTFKAGLVDSPELYGITENRPTFYFISTLSLLFLFMWVYQARVGIRLFLYVLAPVTVLVSTFYISTSMRNLLTSNVYDKAGIFARNYLSTEDLSKLTVVSSEPGGIFRTLFYLDNAKSSFDVLPNNSVIEYSKLQSEKEWALVIGSYTLPQDDFLKIPLDGFSLVRTTDRHGRRYDATLSQGIDFTRKSLPSFIKNINGLSGSEPWGRWSDANEGEVVHLEFVDPLPKKFVLVLSALAFGPNVGKAMEVKVGSQAYKVILPDNRFEIRLPINLDGDAQSIDFRPPQPTSTEELGLGKGGRKLGVGFIALRLEN